MIRRLTLLCGALFLIAASVQPASAQQPAPAAPSGGVYVVTYLEVGTASVAKAAAVLRKLSAAARREDGSLGFIALRERARPGRFAIIEGWKDKTALDAHAAKAAAMLQPLQTLYASPPDSRPSNPLSIAEPKGTPEPGLKTYLYVVTHVDVVPTAKDEAVGLVTKLAEESRNDDGNLRFDVLQQGNRANHMTVVELWRDRTAHNLHVMLDHTRTFRGSLLPLEGALYDERIYEPIR